METQQTKTQSNQIDNNIKWEHLKTMKSKSQPDMVADTFYPSTGEAEADPSLQTEGQPGLQINFQDRQGYKETLSQKQNNQTKLSHTG